MARYSQIVASDLIRDGLGVELWEEEEHVGEVFRSDREQIVTVTLWKENVPLDVVDDWIAYAKDRLLPFPTE